MEELICVEVNYKGTVLPFEVMLVNLGYSYRVSVTIDDIEVIYKPDETGHTALIKNIKKRAITQKDIDVIDLIGAQLPVLTKVECMAGAGLQNKKTPVKKQEFSQTIHKQKRLRRHRKISQASCHQGMC